MKRKNAKRALPLAEVSSSEIVSCPVCGETASQEEGLFWCDGCGINNYSKVWIDKERENERKQKQSRHWIQLGS